MLRTDQRCIQLVKSPNLVVYFAFFYNSLFEKSMLEYG